VGGVSSDAGLGGFLKAGERGSRPCIGTVLSSNFGRRLVGVEGVVMELGRLLQSMEE
jgi:hypothetical protein